MLPSTDEGRVVLRALLGIGAREIEAALTDDVHGTLRYEW